MVAYRILVIDGDPLVLTLLADELTENGMDVHSAPSAEIALRLARERDYDLILLDPYLPHMSGLAVLERLRRTGVHAPAVIFSAMVEESDLARARRLGVEDFVSKPARLDDLIRRIRAVANRARNFVVCPASSIVLPAGYRVEHRDPPPLDRRATH